MPVGISALHMRASPQHVPREVSIMMLGSDKRNQKHAAPSWQVEASLIAALSFGGHTAGT